MLRIALMGLLTVGTPLLAAPVPEPAVPVKGALPSFVNLSQARIDGTTIQANQTNYQTVTKTVPVTIDMGGQKITRVERVTEMVPVTVAVTYDLKNYTIVTGEGKTLTMETALPLLKSASVMLVCDGPVDPAIQKVLSKEALILVKKQAPQPPR